MQRRRTGAFAGRGLAAAAGFLAAGFLLVSPLAAQNPTGDLMGQVTDADGAALSGVAVAATSPSLQGDRRTQTGSSGEYKLALLPPGDYRVSYELEGFANAVREVKVSAAQTSVSNIGMELSTVTEEVVVTGSYETISVKNTAAATIPQAELEKLPVNRDVANAILLNPGVAPTGPSTEPSISGAMTFENLYLLNGVTLNENIRGQLLPLFIEDAIVETTTATSGISAEYGRFTGGVINTITKSGGNEFSGSFRTSFTNDDWVSKTPLSNDRIDNVNEAYEATLGGFVMKDRIWFFGAGRDRDLTGSGQTSLTLLTYATTDAETRVEGKLTLSPHPSHSIIGSYLEIERDRTNSTFGQNLDLDGLSPNRSDPQEIKSVNYTGILTQNVFIEAQYSERDFEIGVGSGGPQELINGTLWRTRTGAFRWGSPTFCGSCETEVRNNENLLAKGSWFLTTEQAGSHDFVFGYDTFEDIRFAINHQTGSDFSVWASNHLVASNGTVYPQVTGDDAWVGWFAVFNLDLARPTSFKTNSLYVNDSWRLNDRLSFNLGVRYDENDGKNSAGAKVASDEKISPRLGLSWDVKGTGDLVLHASAGTYVAAVANSQADSTSGGGAIGLFLSEYGGPLINTNSSCVGAGTCVSGDDALGIIFNWYFNNGGTDDLDGDLSNIPNLISVSIPGETAIIPGTIKSPATTEITVGVNQRLGNKGSVRADLVYRDWEDFYANKTIFSQTGIVQTPNGAADLTHVGNFDEGLERTYKGLHTQFRYRLTDRFTLAGNYTLSQTEGNVNGENSTSGPLSTSTLAYPEYFDRSWSFPKGDLLTDQRHRARVWGIYDIFDTQHHKLSVSLLQSFLSGTPYGAAGAVNTRPFVTNPGYQTPPASVTYFFTDRDAFTTDDTTRTDLSLNYSFLWGLGGRDIEVYLQPEVINALNEDGVLAVNTTIITATSTTRACGGARCATFNPFTTQPVEGVHWARGPSFGKPTVEDSFQQPRTYRFSVGFRF